ncbi:hypothetical protein A7A08_03216 [Methyloligella halotolerans]|uniref:Uncharacterized protein n=1 Tax=Methyloligella halotolerans TaxID=1177755 RepID=A0A1E2RUK7_9HYPH|nr:hypothetical protein A7A08_03216 [Methyloligella halotolerans]
MELVGGRPNPDLEVPLLGHLAHPDAEIIVAAHDPEVVLAEPEHGAVVDHAAMVVAEGGVDHLALAQLADVAGGDQMHQLFGVGPRHLELAQGGEIHDHRLLPAGPVFLDGLHVGEAGGQPEAAIIFELAGQRGEARIEAALPRQARLCVGGHAMGLSFREVVLLVVNPHLDVRGAPAIGRVDIVGAGRRGADDVGQRAEQHVVPGPRPGLVQPDPVIVVDEGVVEEVDRRPALAGRDRIGLQTGVEVVRAVGMARIAHILVILGVAGQHERVVAADRVLDHLHERLLGLVVVFGMQARAGRSRAHQRMGGGGVEAVLDAALQGFRIEGQEVGALTALHVDDLDIVAGLHRVGRRGRRIDAQIQLRLRQRRRRIQPLLAPLLDLDQEIRGRVLLVRRHCAARRHQHAKTRGLDLEPGLRARRAIRPEQTAAADLALVHVAGAQRMLRRRPAFQRFVKRLFQGRRIQGGEGRDHRLAALRLRQGIEQPRLRPFRIDDGELIAVPDPEGQAAAPGHTGPADAPPPMRGHGGSRFRQAARSGLAVQAHKRSP